MKLAYATDDGPQPAVRRLNSLVSLGSETRHALAQAAATDRTYAPRRELIVEGRPISGTLLILDGWAARLRELADGRRQIINFLLPGDLIGRCGQPQPIASSTVVAITPVRACAVPEAGEFPDFDQAAAMSGAIEEAHLLAQVTRLGRLTAHERIVDILLEFLERLELAGLASNNRFRMPITQEALADALGLTPVHINRTLQLARKSGELDWREKMVILHDREALQRQVGRTPSRVSEALG